MKSLSGTGPLLFSFESMALRDADQKRREPDSFLKGFANSFIASASLLLRPSTNGAVSLHRFQKNNREAFTHPVVTVFGFLLPNPKRAIFFEPDGHKDFSA